MSPPELLPPPPMPLEELLAAVPEQLALERSLGLGISLGLPSRICFLFAGCFPAGLSATATGTGGNRGGVPAAQGCPSGLPELPLLAASGLHCPGR